MKKMMTIVVASMISVSAVAAESNFEKECKEKVVMTEKAYDKNAQIKFTYSGIDQYGDNYEVTLEYDKVGVTRKQKYICSFEKIKNDWKLTVGKQING